MAEITSVNTQLGLLRDMLNANDIGVGDDPSYELCKLIYLYHPLGAKMAEIPISLAQSQERIIEIPGAPEGVVVEQFLKTRKFWNCDEIIFNAAVLARVYGVSTIASVAESLPPAMEIPINTISEVKGLAFNVLDPLNTSGSYSALLDPNDPNFMKYAVAKVTGRDYHPSRVAILQNGKPVYLAWTASSYGYVGRSVYQRGLFLLKSFIHSMRADAMVAKKVGLLVAKLKMPGSVMDDLMSKAMGQKRTTLKVGQTDEVISISTDEEISAIDLTNIDGAHESARKHILENLAASDGMPAVLLNNETYAEGFSDGAEDAKNVARYIEKERKKLNPVYEWFDIIMMRLAWTPEFYKTVQEENPDEWGNVKYEVAFQRWRNAFVANWPSLLIEPDSEKIKVEEVKFNSMVKLAEAFLPQLDPTNKVRLLQAFIDNVNENKMLFPNPIILDLEALQTFLEEAAAQQKEMQDQAADFEEEPKPRSQ